MKQSAAQQLAALFDGSEKAHTEWTPSRSRSGTGGKVQGQYLTIKGPAESKHWQAHLDGTRGLTVIPIKGDWTCIFGAIDIDVNSIDHAALEKKIEGLNLPLITAKSKSGGAHLYLFLAAPTAANEVRRHLKNWAGALGYIGAEVFPKQEILSDGEVGSAINMPYFGANKVDIVDRHAILNGKQISLIHFIDLAVKKKVTLVALDELTLPELEDLEGAPTCLATLTRSGFPHGSRNLALFNLAVYARKRYGDDAWESHVDAMNRRYMEPPLSSSEVLTVIKSAKRKKYFYRCSEHPIVSACDKKACAKCKYGMGNDDADPGVNFAGLEKITSNPPTWILDVNGAKLELTTSELLDYSRVRIKAMDKLNIIPTRIKPSTWERMVKDMLQKVEEIPAPEDSGVDGEFWEMVDEFCTSRTAAKSKDEIPLHKPWTHDGKTYFQAKDLRGFLDRKKFKGGQGFGPHKMFAVIKRMGGDATMIRIQGKPTRVWVVPEFLKQTDEYEVPDASKTREI